MNRQIRRMCEYFGYEVTKLERTRIMNISLKGLPLGEWRELTEQELAGIFKMIEHSSSTKEPAKQKSRNPVAASSAKPSSSAPSAKIHSAPRSNNQKTKSKSDRDRTGGKNTSARNTAKPSKGKSGIKGKSKSPRR